MYRKRERTQNWSLEEKLYLLELVKSRLDVLENKRIDSASSAMKGLAWQDIHAGFAARFGSDRDAHRVREQWRRMKGQSRTEMLEFAERVRTYGAEVANQRRPSALAEEVWRTLELARRLNAFHQQSFGTGDDLGSPVNLDDDEDDTEDVMDTDGCHPAGSVGDMRNLNGFSSSRHDMAADLLLQAGRRSDRVSEEDPLAPGHGQHDGDRDDASDADQDDGAAVADRRHNSSAPGLMSMLRPKVELELNDVPELDTSMVPSGLSITAVKLGGGTPVSGLGHNSAKRRALERAEASVRSWGSPGGVASGLPTHLPSAAPTSTLNPAAVVPAPGASLLECKRMEHRRRLEMMEEEHQAKMELLRLEKDTAKARRRIASAEEAAALSCTACRACGAVMKDGERDSAAVKRPAVSTSGCPDQEQDGDGDGDASSVVSRGSSSALGSGPGPGPGPGSLLNGAREEDDDNNSQDE